MMTYSAQQTIRLSAVPWIESLGHFCAVLGPLMSLKFGWLYSVNDWSTPANVNFVSIGMLAASGQIVSPPVAGNWQLVDGTFTLDKSGGNDVLLINGPVSEFGYSWYKNWTSAAASFCPTGLLQCLRTHFMHTCQCG